MKKWITSLVFFCLATPALAMDCSNMGSTLSRACEKINDINTQGKRDIYLTGYHWYPRHQEEPITHQKWGYGAGVGKSLMNDAGNEHMVYGLAFADQKKHAQLLVGYSYQAYWNIVGDLKLGVGYSAGLTSKRNQFHRIPFPYLLPMASVKYRALTLYATYIPNLHGVNQKNRVFLFGKYTFN